MSRITKANAFGVYRIRAGWHDQEWATIVVQGWTVPADAYCSVPREVGEILIHSSFGSWAYQWGHLGVPFKVWLASTENKKHYIAEKLLGDKAYRFDGARTVKELRECVIAWRRGGDFGREQARRVWDWVEENELELEASSDSFVSKMYDGPRDCDTVTSSAGFFEEPWEHLCTSLDPQFEGFWTQLWPVFETALREEVTRAI